MSDVLDRREVVARLVARRGDDLLVVTGLGSASYDVMAAGDNDRNYYLGAAMGSAAMVGLGLAKAQRGRSVLVITGDGELMMGMGALATIAVQKPDNLTIAVLDNEYFGVTGMQTSHSGLGVAIDKVAQSLNFAWAGEIRDWAGVDELRGRAHARRGLSLGVVKIASANAPRVLPPRDGVHVKNRFRAALGFAPI